VATRIPIHPDASHSLASAVIASSTAPLLLLGADLTVICASRSFCQAFSLDPAAVTDVPLMALGDGEWDVPQLRALLGVVAAGATDIDAYEMDLKRPGQGARCLVVNARKLDYDLADGVRLLLSIADVTDARLAEKLKDDLLREKAILLQEVQHRVANSLQIIASVLLQNARRVQSHESRGHLQDAHNRVMSVAALQQQLAASRLGDVELRTYFTGLCSSIGASMIRDHDQLTLEVTADDTATSADTSVSLGLIVTELVINALKHAFPGHRQGKILVDYRSDGTAWALTVSDNGAGMPRDEASAKSGLGTSIVEALAAQLGAVVEIADAKPGARVTIRHAAERAEGSAKPVWRRLSQRSAAAYAEAMNPYQPWIDRWRLVPDGDPFTTPWGSHLAPVRFEGKPAMLKVAVGEEETKGGLLMAWWDGQGAAQVYAQQDEATLMERLAGPRSLAAMATGGQDDQATAILCHTAAGLHAPRGRPPPASLVPLDIWFRALEPAAAAHGGTFEKAAVQARHLLATPRDPVVLHGDYHHDNVLDGGERGWLVIDPKGVFGERDFEFANLFRNPTAALALTPGRMRRQAKIVAREAKVAPRRLLRWILAYAGLGAAWSLQSGHDAQPGLDIAEVAAVELGL
jgi:streptomycin 6-kinase/two-component sensor histidine kinase